jgi:hypothetical protein
MSHIHFSPNWCRPHQFRSAHLLGELGVHAIGVEPRFTRGFVGQETIENMVTLDFEYSMMLLVIMKSS